MEQQQVMVCTEHVSFLRTVEREQSSLTKGSRLTASSHGLRCSGPNSQEEWPSGMNPQVEKSAHPTAGRPAALKDICFPINVKDRHPLTGQHLCVHLQTKSPISQSAILI